MAKKMGFNESVFDVPVIPTEVVVEEIKPTIERKKVVAVKKTKVVEKQRDDVPITSQGTQHTFVIREDLWQRLKSYSKNAGINLVNIINASIEQYLDGEK